ncbi:MAG: hypothetical protein AAB328_07925 [candidate division NC10 bacterium]
MAERRGATRRCALPIGALALASLLWGSPAPAQAETSARYIERTEHVRTRR